MPVVGAPATTSSVILDPVTVDATNVELDISTGNYGLTAHSYPTPSVIAQWASSVSTEGARLGTKRHDNRQISITVEVNGLGALQDLEAKLAKLYREGGTLKRIYTDGREIVFDVLVMDGYEPTFDDKHTLGDVTTVQFTLTCAPYGRGSEITLTSHSETTAPFLIFTETGIQGDMPALGRLVLSGQASIAFDLAHWGIQSRYYNSASAAALFYEAEALDNVTASTASRSGASGGQVAKIASGDLGTSSWTSASSLATTSDIYGAHVGTFRVLARVFAPNTNTGTVSVRCQWGIGNGTNLTTNDAVAIAETNGTPIENTFTVVDLGLITLPAATRGTAAWTGYLEAISTAAGDSIEFDWVAFIPVDEGCGEIGQPGSAIVPNKSTEVAYDGVHVLDDGGYRPPGRYVGDYLRIPPAGPENRTLRVIVKLTSNQQELLRPASQMTSTLNHAEGSLWFDMTGQLIYRPRFLVVPT